MNMLRPALLWLLAMLHAGCAACPKDDLGVPGPTLLRDDFAEHATRNRPSARQVTLEEMAQAIAYPIIDIHVHTFNARYLPLQNILLGKRDMNPLLILLTNRKAKAIAAAIVGATHLSELPRTDNLATRTNELATQRVFRSWADDRADVSNVEVATAQAFTSAEDTQWAQDLDTVQALSRVSQDLGKAFRAIDEAIDLGAEERALKRLEAVEADLELQLSRSARTELRRALERIIGDDDASARQFIEFLESLITPDGDVEARFHRDYGNAVDLCVSHTMDLAPVYAQEEDGDTLLRFESDQLPRIDAFQRQDHSRMVYFVAYNPFRDNRGHGGDALSILRRALEERGAYGVKLYPPSGYRPSHNRIPHKPRALFTTEPLKQWEYRYADLTGEQLDARLGALFEFCLERDLPIFVHCNTGEFEARRGYGVCMADPRWWRDVLAKYPKLRVCFGHAGGADFWFGTQNDHEAWGRLVYELCVLYENVYCEFGVLHHVITDRQREHFVAVLGELLRSPQGAYPFESKLLYGSDWYMPGSGEPRAAELRAWQATFLHPDLIAHYPAFFCGNAIRYLDVARRVASTEETGGAVPPLPEPVRARLSALLHRFALRERARGQALGETEP